ncbi:MAG: hypothetical protein MK212_08815 [Saprospiraceae bacterium]|nr:hypothetical protein [Saprospiraceae bacterium]
MTKKELDGNDQPSGSLNNSNRAGRGISMEKQLKRKDIFKSSVPDFLIKEKLEKDKKLNYLKKYMSKEDKTDDKA